MNPIPTGQRRWQALAEIILIFSIFFLHGAYPVPDSNEAHYLAKAKHYWNSDWAAGDFFLESADAHLVFYWTFGWLTLWLSLEQVAWVGRVLTWALLALSWRRLSFVLAPRAWMSVLSAAVFVGLNENAHMAGEWVVGGIEAKGFAYALVFFALERLARGRWSTGWVLLGLATLAHVLVGGWGMIAAAVVWIMTRSAGQARHGEFRATSGTNLRGVVPALVVAIILAAPSVYMGFSLSGDAGPATIAEANRIYVFERLPHHLIATQVAPGFLTRHLLLQGAWLLLLTFTPAATVGERSVRWFVATTIVVSWLGLALIMLLRAYPEPLAALLRYYWFRASDVFVPLGVAIELVRMIGGLSDRRVLAVRLWLGGTILLAAIDTLNQVGHLPFRVLLVHDAPATPRADKNVNYSDWREVCDWIFENTRPDDLVLVPRGAATLKWYTGRPEVANWKDVPQDAKSIVEWWRRMQALHGTGKSDDRWHPSLSEQGAARLAALMDEYRANYVIVALRADLTPLPGEPLFQNDSFAIYRREQLEAQ